MRNLQRRHMDLAARDYEAYTKVETAHSKAAATGKGHFTDKAINDVLGANRTKVIWSDNHDQC